MSQADYTARSLRAIALVLLLGWSSLTSLYGAMTILTAAENWQMTRHPEHASSILLWVISTLVFLGWWLALGLVVPAAVLGVIAMVRLRRGVAAYLTFLFLVLGAPFAAVAYTQVGVDNAEYDPFRGDWARRAIEGFSFPVVALAVLIGAWLLLRDPPEPSVALPAPVHQP